VRLVLEYMDGGDLQVVVSQRRDSGGGKLFPAHFSRRVLAAVGGALAHVHAAGVLHRDVKPANILLARRSQRIKLGDFGVAKLVEAATLKAQTLVGTPFYFSPELVSGDEYGPASDCWALGACMYEVAMLRRPFDAANQLALIRKICEDQYAELAAEIAEDVRAVINGMLIKCPRQRLKLADALRASPAIAALVVEGNGEVGRSEEEEGADGDQDWESDEEVMEDVVADGGGYDGSNVEALTLLPSWPQMGTIGGGDSWAGAQLLDTREATRCPLSPLGAVARARAVLAAEVDDPEDLQEALADLENERAEGGAGAMEDAARESLTEELRVRLSALRVEAAALLDDLLLLGRTASPKAAAAAAGADKAGSAARCDATLRADPSSPLAAAPSPGSDSPRSDIAGASDAEDALEVATTLGVDTAPAEERLASVRRMLSVRVVWGDTARFCLLPMRVTYAALVRQVRSRFSLLVTAPALSLCWAEASEAFALDSQAAWEECLQLRGLMENPGRIELRVTGAPPGRKRRVKLAVVVTPHASRPNSRAAEHKPSHSESPVLPSGSCFVVTGTQAFRSVGGGAGGAAAAGSSLEFLPPGQASSPPFAFRPGGGCGGAGGGAALSPGDCGGRGMGVVARRRKQGDVRRGSNPGPGTAASAAAAGRAWAVSTGREQPVRWAPAPAGVTGAFGYAASTASSPGGAPGGVDGLGLCLEGRATSAVFAPRHP